MTNENRDPMKDPRDPGTEPAGAHAGTGARGSASSEGVGNATGGPDAERDRSGLGDEPASGRGGWQGSEPSQSETGALGRGETGSMGSGGGAEAQSGAGTDISWSEQAAGQTGGAQGQDAVMGGESWEGRDRDTGMGGWTQDDSGRTRSEAHQGDEHADGPTLADSDRSQRSALD